MDIRLRAKLSAYSKADLDINSSSESFPSIDSSNAGDIVGVNNLGDYTLFNSVENSMIDELFLDNTEAISVNKDKIDTLFEDDADIATVSKDAIDSLFK